MLVVPAIIQSSAAERLFVGTVSVVLKNKSPHTASFFFTKYPKKNNTHNRCILNPGATNYIEYPVTFQSNQEIIHTLWMNRIRLEIKMNFPKKPSFLLFATLTKTGHLRLTYDESRLKNIR